MSNGIYFADGGTLESVQDALWKIADKVRKHARADNPRVVDRLAEMADEISGLGTEFRRVNDDECMFDLIGDALRQKADAARKEAA